MPFSNPPQSMKQAILLLAVLLVFSNCNSDDPDTGTFTLNGAFAGAVSIALTGDVTESVPVDRTLTLVFSQPLDETSLQAGISLAANGQTVSINTALSSQTNAVSISASGTLLDNTTYTFTLTSSLKSASGQSLEPVSFQFKTKANALELLSATFNGQEALQTSRLQNVPVDLEVEFSFSTPIDQSSFEQALNLSGINYSITYTDNNRKALVNSSQSLTYLKKYQLNLSNQLTSEAGGSFEGFEQEFYTQIDPTPKFAQISDEELLTKVQEQTFKYFWDFAHPVSGLARERDTSGDLVTIGGSGFGVMTILVGIERGFITRQEGVDRLQTIVNFLLSADRFHGVWPHWMNGGTGKTIPFSSDDNGGDLVETAFMIQGLLTVRQYLNAGNDQESSIMANITRLWEEVEWDWYTQDGQDVLYWHWSPDMGWIKNLKIRGWNESLIVYVLAASSPTHPISTDVYHDGWARNGGMANGNNYYTHNLPLGPDRGGPLFFSHYSFLGLDPRNLSDQYADYWTQNVNHSMINRAYCQANPLSYVGYGDECWGLTASDGDQGYSAHSPSNDRGVITPTAALSAMPYTPDESMEALRHFYYLLGDRLWGEYGFYDAFNLTENWTANSFLAIDQGPIIIMIENHRSGLLWNHFMQDSEITAGLQRLGFDTD